MRHTVVVAPLVLGGPTAPRLPSRSPTSVAAELAASALVHLVAAILLAFVLVSAPPGQMTVIEPPPTHADLTAPRIVFIPSEGPGGGGGGGGNRQPAPIRRAEAPGRDAMTLRVVRPIVASGAPAEEPPPAAPLLLEARPLASGAIDQIGLPAEGVPFGTSTGPGSGGGVGEGTGTGIGPGRGPGLGPGSGGGTGGGVYRAGGGVTPPRLITQVLPRYTDEALASRIQGTVELEAIVRRDGRPSDLRVVRSLDRGGLDERALEAVRQWRFEPGRLAGLPVDVVVTVVLDFSIR